jgi:hypothetical protein
MRAATVLLVALAFGSMLPAEGANLDSKPYESKAGRYKVTFPGQPAVDSKKLADGEVNIASVPQSGGGFVVMYTDLAADKIKDVKPKDILAGGEKATAETFKAKITSSKDTEFGKQKYPAREMAGEALIAEEGVVVSLRLTIILADNRLYQVFAFGPKDLPKGKDADKFFESFEIVK